MGKEALAMSRYFENELIEQIKDANDIVSVVSELAAADAARTKKHHERHAAAPEH